MERKTVGVMILTVATLLLLSGLWCIYLSPTVIYGPSDVNTAWYREFREPNFLPNATVSYTFTVEEGQYVRIWLVNVELPSQHRICDVFIYDPENKIVCQRTSDYPIGLVPKKTGQYALKIHNQPYVETDLTVEITGYYAASKPLIPAGQLLTLISLPLYGLSIWLITKKTVTASSNTMRSLLFLLSIPSTGDFSFNRAKCPIQEECEKQKLNYLEGKRLDKWGLNPRPLVEAAYMVIGNLKEIARKFRKLTPEQRERVLKEL